tara:strand:+ start:174 stop:464 length:291 start_codon:yes stop_codon:yes gene_type:complete
MELCRKHLSISLLPQQLQTVRDSGIETLQNIDLEKYKRNQRLLNKNLGVDPLQHRLPPSFLLQLQLALFDSHRGGGGGALLGDAGSSFVLFVGRAG